jgi:hypothetical protein
MSTYDTPWVEAFDFLSTEEITVEKTQAVFGDGRCWCRLCEATLTHGERARHAREHKREMRVYRERRRKAAVKAATQNLVKARRSRATVTA